MARVFIGVDPHKLSATIEGADDATRVDHGTEHHDPEPLEPAS